MDVLEYRTSTYGEFGGLLNRAGRSLGQVLHVLGTSSGRGSGRAYDLEAALAAPRSGPGRRVSRSPGRAVRARARGRRSGPTSAPRARPLLVRIPLDFYRMLQETDVGDAEIKAGSRSTGGMATRQVFQALFGRGYRVVDFLKTESGGARQLLRPGAAPPLRIR